MDQPTNLSPTYLAVQQIVATLTGTDPETILPESHLEEDIGIVLDTDFERIINRINHDFRIKLDSSQTSEETETMQDLVTLVEEELELG